MDVQNILHLPDGEFVTTLKKLKMEDIVNLIQELQDEMSYEQSHFNVLKSQLEQNEGGDVDQGKVLTKELEESQERLSQLMERTRQCFAQQTAAQETLFKADYKVEDEVVENGDQAVESMHKVEESTYCKENNNVDTVENLEFETSSNAVEILKPSEVVKSAATKYNNGMANPPNNADNFNVMEKSSDNKTHLSFHSGTSLQITKDKPNNVNTNLEHSINKENRTLVNTENEKANSNKVINTSLVTQNNTSSHVSFNPALDKKIDQQPKMYTIRSMNDRNSQHQNAQASSHNIEVGEASDESVLSVSAARSLFESNSQKTGNSKQNIVKVKRNISIGSKGSEASDKPQNVAPWQSKQTTSQPAKSVSMQNLNKPTGNIPIENNLKNTSTKAFVVSSGNVSHSGIIKSSSGPIKPMGKVPNVRTAWSQKPASEKTVKPTEQQPLKSRIHSTETKVSSKTERVKGQSESAERVNVESTFQMPKLKPVQTKTATYHEGRVIDQPKAVQVIPKNKPLPDDRVPPALSTPMTRDSEGFLAEDNVQERVTLKGWDPTPLLEDLYEVSLQDDDSNDDFVYKNVEGYMEKLPLNKKKATLLKTWKKRYFKAHGGNLYYYEVEDLEKATGCLPLGGGSIEDLGDLMLGIDDGRGRYLVVRCANDKEFGEWKTALESQVVSNMTSKWVKPLHSAPPHTDKKVIVIDLGSCSIRAGILANQPTLPELFFPTVVGIDQETHQEYVGYECAKPEIRSKCKFIFPVRPSVKVDKFSLNLEVMPALFRYVFKNLKINPKEYWIMFSSPANFSDKIKEEFMNMFIKNFGVAGVNIVNQTLLALYSYNAMSGIVVDIGERLEIVPVTDGYIVEQGVSRQPYGGHRIAEALNTCFTEKRYRFFTDVEFQIVRLALEKSCFVSQNYEDDLKQYNEKPENVRKAINLQKYNLPKGSWTEVNNDLGRFKGPEGMFNLEVWGMDNPPLQKLIQSAVQASPMDTRREMWRSIYLSGGVTMLPGFTNRLEAELNKLVPGSITVEIHASPQRYHAAYIGACALAGMGVYEQSCITAKEWLDVGPPVLRKWHMY